MKYKYTFIALMILTIMYLGGSFFSMNFDFREWSDFTRGLVSIFAVVAMIMTIVIREDNRPSENSEE